MRFQKIPCETCKSDRVLGCECTNCGRRPRVNEVNSHVVRRRSAVARVDDLISGPLDQSEPIPVSVSTLVDLAESFSTGITELAGTDGSPSSVENMAEIIRLIYRLRSAHDEFPTLRPNVSSKNAVSVTLARLSELWNSYRAVLISSEPLEAQQLNLISQRQLDVASVAIASQRKRIRALEIFEDPGGGPLFERALVALRVMRPGLDLMTISSAGSREAAEATGVHVSDAMGAPYLVAVAVAEVHMDIDRFDRVVREASQYCFDNDLLESVSLQAGALESLAEANRTMAELFTVLEAFLLRESDESAIVRRLLKIHAEIYEGVGLPVFAWYASISGLKTRPFHKILEDGASAIANTLAQSDLSAWFAGSESYLRHAGQHGSSFTVKGENVTFHLKSHKETRTVSGVIDTIFTLLESLSATFWALQNALDSAGIEIPLVESDANYIGATPSRLLEIALGELGEKVVSINTTDGDWHLTLAGKGDVLQIATVVATWVGGTVRNVSVRREGEFSRLLILPFREYARYLELFDSEADTVDRMVSLLRLRSMSTADQIPVADGKEVSHVIAIVGLKYIQGDLSMVGRLRDVLKLAKILEDDRAVELIATVFRYARGFRIPHSELELELNSYLSQGVFELPKTENIRLI